MHVVLVFADLSNQASVDGVDYWVREARDNGANSVMVVGNKAESKKVQDLEKIAKDRGCAYF